MPSYLTDILNRRITPQSQPIPGETMVPNNAGGFTYQTDCWARLERFLILGSEGGTYYVKQQDLTRQNITCVQQCLDTDVQRTLEMIVAVSDAGRAPKNEPAILALALACGHPEGRKYAYRAMPKVCRIPTDLFHFVAYCKKMRGSSMGLRKAISRWYQERDPDGVAYHMVKYQQRDGWTHRDLLRLAHPKPVDELHSQLYRYAVNKPVVMADLPEIVGAMKLAHEPGTSTAALCSLITKYRLTHEMIPSETKTKPEIWDALLPHMPMGAMIRNLGNMSKVGLITHDSEASRHIVDKLHEGDYIRRSRLHPLGILIAMKTYSQGRGMRGSGAWTAVPSVVDALDDAFYLAFDNVQATGKRLLLACDISGSMRSQLAGYPITCAEAVGALAMVTLKAEGVDHCEVVGFSHELIPIPLSPRQRLDDVVRYMLSIKMGQTDCAQPMLYAAHHNKPIDGFVVLTDNETWYGQIHPMQALRLYRERFGLASKLCVVGMTATDFSIADPNDPGCLDVVGFDTAIPNVISEFLR